MSANLYIIKSTETGRYLNGKFNTWHNKIVLASYATTEFDAMKVARLYNYTDYEIEKISEYDFTSLLASETTKMIIQLESVLFQMEELRFNIPSISMINKNTHKILKNACENIKFINPYFQSFIKEQEDATFDVKAVYENFIHELAKVDLWECENLTGILKAYKKDPKSIIGICKKINA